MFHSLLHRKASPPTHLATGTKCSTSFSMTRKPLKSCTCCFLRSHRHPLTLWVVIGLTLWEAIENWDLDRGSSVFKSPFLPLFPSGRAGFPSLGHTVHIRSLPFFPHCWPDCGYRSHRDLEVTVSGVPHSSHSWDTQYLVSESQGVPLMPSSAFHIKKASQPVADALLSMYCPNSEVALFWCSLNVIQNQWVEIICFIVWFYLLSKIM